ncbi:hypothetical protein ACFFSH_39350 [Streptomyces filamentosus]|uniref:Uncharacterized protein n=1 Tax=Streptomyces filamentosus TaxID=67294 RepID=A0A919BUH2_STRFL|nr:hypothetical protein [Streptomyces filamentosus]GHG15349.1 hypothetical protein GCM10017667_56120 [Streptomyces filamentosus]
MTDQPKPCRSTQHCAVHGFCHRCTPSLDDATAHLVEAIDAAGIEYPTASRVYAQLAATVRDAARTAARQTTGQDDTEPTLRDRLRRAICEAEGFTWDTDMLEPDEYGDHADAVLQVLSEPLPQRKEFAAPAVGQPAEAHGVDRAAILDEAIEAVLGRVEAYEGMGQDAVDRNRERTAIVSMLRCMAVEGER